MFKCKIGNFLESFYADINIFLWQLEFKALLGSQLVCSKCANGLFLVHNNQWWRLPLSACPLLRPKNAISKSLYILLSERAFKNILSSEWSTFFLLPPETRAEITVFAHRLRWVISQLANLAVLWFECFGISTMGFQQMVCLRTFLRTTLTEMSWWFKQVKLFCCIWNVKNEE